jgi:hypothetical protein
MYNACPLELEILGVLPVFGRGGPFDNNYDGTGISEETHRVFFKEFIRLFVDHFYHHHVHRPNEEELPQVLRAYERLGFPGCIGSVDCVHIWWDKCPTPIRATCKGKESYPTLSYKNLRPPFFSYEVVCDHSKRIHTVAGGFYGATSDKTISVFHKYLTDINDGIIFGDVEFTLYTDDGEAFAEKGAYLLSDGGYHKWRCLQCPIPQAFTTKESNYSCSLESCRKDVKDVFGILKMRFRILKNPIQLHTQEDIDMIFYACATLHNMLLTIDSVDSEEDHTDPDQDYDDEYDDAKMAVIEARANDRLGRAPSTSVTKVEYSTANYELREKLINNYDYLLRNRRIH